MSQTLVFDPGILCLVNQMDMSWNPKKERLVSI